MPCQAPHGLEEDEDATFPAEPEAPLALPMEMGGEEMWGGGGVYITVIPV